MISEESLLIVTDRYVNKPESLAKIAKEYRVPYNYLKEILVKKGIKIRNKTESLQKYVKYSTCVVCGRQFRMREKWDSTTNHHKLTCGDPNCLHELRSTASKSKWTDERKVMMSEKLKGRDTSNWNVQKGEDRPNWKGGKSSAYYRHMAFDVYKMEKQCIITGCNSQDLCVHHKDGDRTNNSRENLEIRCKSHHTDHHNENGDTGWQILNKRIMLNISADELSKELASGKSFREISEEYKVSFKPLKRLADKYDIKKPEQYDIPKEDIVKLLSEGKSVRGIGKLYDIPHSTMDSIVKRIQ